MYHPRYSQTFATIGRWYGRQGDDNGVGTFREAERSRCDAYSSAARACVSRRSSHGGVPLSLFNGTVVARRPTNFQRSWYYYVIHNIIYYYTIIIILHIAPPPGETCICGVIIYYSSFTVPAAAVCTFSFARATRKIVYASYVMMLSRSPITTSWQRYNDNHGVYYLFW